jgi:hypothetical protein
MRIKTLGQESVYETRATSFLGQFKPRSNPSDSRSGVSCLIRNNQGRNNLLWPSFRCTSSGNVPRSAISRAARLC